MPGRILSKAPQSWRWSDSTSCTTITPARPLPDGSEVPPNGVISGRVPDLKRQGSALPDRWMPRACPGPNPSNPPRNASRQVLKYADRHEHLMGVQANRVPGELSYHT